MKGVPLSLRSGMASVEPFQFILRWLLLLIPLTLVWPIHSKRVGVGVAVPFMLAVRATSYHPRLVKRLRAANLTIGHASCPCLW